MKKIYLIFLFILIGILRLKQVNKKHDKIYGNAYDEQYSLQPLRFCNNMEKKNLIIKTNSKLSFILH